MSLRNAVVALVFAVGSAGCSNEEVLHGDLSFTAEERAQIVAAADDWRVFSKGLVNYRVVFDGSTEGPSIVRVTEGSRTMVIAEKQYRGSQMPAGWHVDGDIYLVPSRLTDHGTLRTMAMHEMGHAAGLDHISEPGSIMSPQPSLSFSAQDLAECRRVSACD